MLRKKISNEELKEIIRNHGPVAVQIYASPAFDNYTSGIFESEKCDGKREKLLNHAVVIIGYGTSGTTPFWIVKNSWGAHRGENGFVRMAMRDKNQDCGIKQKVYYLSRSTHAITNNFYM